MKASWPTPKLSEICEIKPPKSEARNAINENDNVSFLPMEDLGINQRQLLPVKTRRLKEVAGSYTYFADGDVLLAKITPCFENGKLGIASNLTNAIGFGSSEYIVFRPSNELTKEWLFYYLSRDTFRREGSARMSGAVGHKRVSADFIESNMIPVPPIAEQERIVSILDQAFAVIATAKASAELKLKYSTDIYRSCVDSVFTSSGSGWTQAYLSDYCDFINGDRGENYPSRAIQSEVGVPFINAGHLSDDGVSVAMMNFIPRERFDLLGTGKIKSGDILFCLRGSLGKFAGVGKLKEGAIASSLVIVRPRKTILDEFVMAYFSSSLCASMIKKYKNGTAQPNLSAASLREFALPVTSIENQTRICQKLNEIRLNTKALKNNGYSVLAALDELKQSFLTKAFSGEL